jgi:hypothetical protein
MIIKVKQKHIRKGIKSSPTSCPIALAVTEHLNKDGLNVDQAGVYKRQTGEQIFTLSRSAQRFIQKFDKTGKGKPFNFKLNYEPAKN